MTLEPRTLARSRQADRQNHNPLRRTRSCCRSCNRSRRSSRFCWSLGFRSLVGTVGGSAGRTAFGGYRRERLSDSLLASAASAATSSAAAASLPAATFSARGRWRGFLRRLNWRCVLVRRPRFILCRWSFSALGLALRRFGCSPFGLFAVEISRLQRRWHRFRCRFGSFLFAALQALAHPFTHVQACNTDAIGGAIRREPTKTAAATFFGRRL